MILKLDPRYPVVWRSPSSVQVGIDPPVVVVEGLTSGQERLLAALGPGVSDAGIGIVTREAPAQARELLDVLAPALLPPPGPAAEPLVVALSGTGPLADELARILAGSGVHVLTSPRAEALVDEGADVAVAVAHYVLAPELHAVWLRRDVPHLPIVFSDSAVRIGPIVEPGTGPCLRCLELHHRDRDIAWPAIATQLVGRRGAAESALLASEGAAAAARLILDRLAEGARASSVSLRIDADTGERTHTTWRQHPDCGCRGIEHLGAVTARGRSGIDWAAAARNGRGPGSPTS
ncbi:MAG: TOMM precursor leader peptide-binding protein [Actinobacteria bacterium]|nr:TOMM precursor leader peptide-binding protein [Actinomycetota bacterium]